MSERDFYLFSMLRKLEHDQTCERHRGKKAKKRETERVRERERERERERLLVDPISYMGRVSDSVCVCLCLFVFPVIPVR